MSQCNENSTNIDPTTSFLTQESLSSSIQGGEEEFDLLFNSDDDFEHEVYKAIIAYSAEQFWDGNEIKDFRILESIVENCPLSVFRGIRRGGATHEERMTNIKQYWLENHPNLLEDDEPNSFRAHYRLNQRSFLL